MIATVPKVEPTMDEHRTISSAAALLADPTRAEMLLVLMDGRSFPASDLAARAHVSNPTASHHLAMLVEAGFVEVVQQGRHRYHRLSNPKIAELIESLGVVARFRSGVDEHPLAPGRSCYNHLAGKLGVHLRTSLESQGVICQMAGAYAVTSDGMTFLRDLGVEETGVSGKACLDWTERVPHVGGGLGRTLFQALLDKGWLRRGDVPRQVCLSEAGQSRFYEAFPIR